MLILEALNALYGDCLLLRYSGPDNKERLWIIDGGPKSEKVDGQSVAVWKDVLLPRLAQIHPKKPVPVSLGMVSHIDDDHINGMQKLTATLVAVGPGHPAEVKFDRFWFNSFDSLVGPKPAGLDASVANVQTASLMEELLPGVNDEHGELVMESIPQGINLAADLRSLNVQGNKPVGDLIVAHPGQTVFNIEGAKVTILGPRQSRIDKLRTAWAAALTKPSKEAREASLQELFLPKKLMDASVPNLSSIVVLVEVNGKHLLLSGDANGDDIVAAWQELGLPAPAIDLLKMPHHGSIRNTSEAFLTFFPAKHYVFSANGKYDNPDAPVVEGVVKLHGDRPITLHFTNQDITWSQPYKLDKGGATAANLTELLAALRTAYPGPWSAKARESADLSIAVDLLSETACIKAI